MIGRRARGLHRASPRRGTEHKGVKTMTHDLNAIDNWTAEECAECMLTLNSEVRDDVAENLEFYREHCRFIVSDDEKGLAHHDAIRLSLAHPLATIQVYQRTWGTFIHRFEHKPMMTLEGDQVTHVATYRNGKRVRVAARGKATS